jgi:GxxExxY protein
METETILQIAAKIMKDMGAGYSESIYQNALHRKLARIDGTCVMEKIIPVVYEGDTLGVCRADIVLEGYVIDVKAVRRMPAGVEKQVCKYVKHLMDQDGKMRKGVVINFNQETEEIETSEHTPEITTSSVEQSPKRRKFTPVNDDADQ